MRYNKEEIEIEALRSVESGRITEKLGKFILDRSGEIANSSFKSPENQELAQVLIDEGVMRCCEKFLHYYRPNESAANLVISMIFSAMYNKMTSLKWSDVYGQKISGKVRIVEDGSIVMKYLRYTKDDNLSKDL
jgi:hypothetical protein